MNEIEAHFAETRERWWAALSEDDRAMLIGCAESHPVALPQEAVSLIVAAKSPAALATHVAWEGQPGGWMLTEGGRAFLLSQPLDPDF